MKVLVTGATGFVGTAISDALEGQGHHVIRLGSREADLTRSGTLEKYSDMALDQIYHLAVWTQAGDFCLTHGGEQWIINQQINTNVLAWWQARQPQAKLVCMGTSCAYAPDEELREENYLAGLPIESLFAYGMTKRMLYAGLTSLHQQYGLHYLCLIPSTLYGPGYHVDGRQWHFIFDLIRKILRGKLYGEPVVLWGDGYQRRELVLLSDFVRITLKLAAEQQDDLINLGAGEEHTIRHFAQLICQHTGYDFDQIHFDTDRYVGARSKRLDIRKLKGLVPDLNLTPLDQGLAQTIAWFLAERERLLPAPVA
jgi:GDP-L-fucose synthase